MQRESFDSYIPCEHCEHITTIGNNKSLTGWTCKAFPGGIPKLILDGYIQHITILDIYPGQVMPYLYKGQEINGKSVNYDGTMEE